MLTNKEFIDSLNDIEQDFDVNSIQYKNLCIWPYLRYLIVTRKMEQISGKTKYMKDGYKKKNINTFPITMIKNSLFKVKMLQKHIASIPKQRLRKCDILFLSKSHERCEIKNGKWYNPYCDSFYDHFGDLHSVQHVELSHLSSPRFPAYHRCFYIDTYLWLAVEKNKLTSMGKRKNELQAFRIHSFEEFFDFLKSTSLFVEIAECDVVFRLERMFSLKKAFEEILIKADPKLFFICCYYHEVAFAAVLACSSKGVTSVEFQHGAQNDTNLFLTNWTSIPVEGYKLLPDFYWSWGKKSADRINKWAGRTSKHKAFVGGNLWLSKWKNDNFKTDNCPQYENINLFPKEFVHILISLQRWPDDFPDFMLEFIKTSPIYWQWHIRPHPRHPLPHQTVTNLKAMHANVEIDKCGKIPLYLLLDKIELHFTGFSTVAFEAALFRAPTFFYDKKAMDGHAEFIDNETFFYANTLDEMRKCVSNFYQNKNNGRKINTRYIITDKDVHFQCLKNMLDEYKMRHKMKS